jgi:hypothetical protein
MALLGARAVAGVAIDSGWMWVVKGGRKKKRTIVLFCRFPKADTVQ